MIVAPHTHWESKLSVILRFESDRYTIGPRIPDPDIYYWPVSFAFAERGPVPYEWADDTILITEQDFDDAMTAIRGANDIATRSKWPLGVSLNFRFKALFSDVLAPTLEYPLDHEVDSDLSAIVSAEDFYSSHEAAGFEQVAWHAHSDLHHNLSESESVLLRSLRESIGVLAEDERAKVLIDIAQMLSQRERSDANDSIVKGARLQQRTPNVGD